MQCRGNLSISHKIQRYSHKILAENDRSLLATPSAKEYVDTLSAETDIQEALHVVGACHGPRSIKTMELLHHSLKLGLRQKNWWKSTSFTSWQERSQSTLKLPIDHDYRLLEIHGAIQQAPGCSFPAEHWSCIFTGGDSKQGASQPSWKSSRDCGMSQVARRVIRFLRKSYLPLSSAWNLSWNIDIKEVFKSGKWRYVPTCVSYLVRNS